MLTLEGFLESVRPAEADWTLTSDYLAQVADAAGAELPVEWVSLFKAFGGHDASAALATVSSTVFSSGATLALADALDDVLEMQRRISDSPLREELGVPLFPLGATTDGDFLVVAGNQPESPVLAIGDAPDCHWFFVASSLRALLDTWVVPAGLGTWPTRPLDSFPALSVTVDRQAAFDRKGRVWESFREALTALVRISPVLGSDLLETEASNRLPPMANGWLSYTKSRVESRPIEARILHLRSRMGAFVSAAMVYAIAAECDGRVLDGVGFFGAGVGVEMSGEESLSALLSLNPEGLELEDFVKHYRNTVAMEVNKVHRYGLK